MMSKQLSGHWIQQRVHFTQVSKSTTGRMVRLENFLKTWLRSGRYPLPPSTGLPTGRDGIETPSRISHQRGISKEYGVSGLPAVTGTEQLSIRSNALRADSTFRSDPHSASRMAWA